MLETALEVIIDEGVSFRFSIVNGGDVPTELSFRDACRADFAVYDGDAAVWRYSDGRAFTQAITNVHLNPGEAATFEGDWPNPTPGEYTAEATLRVRGRDVRARTPFSV